MEEELQFTTVVDDAPVVVRIRKRKRPKAAPKKPAVIEDKTLSPDPPTLLDPEASPFPAGQDLPLEDLDEGPVIADGVELTIDRVSMPGLTLDESLETAYVHGKIVVEIQEKNPAPVEPKDPRPRLHHNRVLNQYRGMGLPLGVIQLIMTARPSLPFLDCPGSSALGLDIDPAIGMGIRMGIWDGIDLGVLRNRSKDFAVYEADIRVTFLDQSWAPVTLAVRGGAAFFARKYSSTGSAGFAELIVERTFWDRVLLLSTLAFHGDSTSSTKNATDINETIGVGSAVEVAVFDWLLLSADAMYGVSGYRERFLTFAVGPKLLAGNFSFAALVTSNDYVTLDGLIANTPRGALDKYLVGINVTGEIPTL